MAFTLRLDTTDQNTLNKLQLKLDKNTSTSTVKHVIQNYDNKCKRLEVAEIKIDNLQNDLINMKYFISEFIDASDTKDRTYRKLISLY